ADDLVAPLEHGLAEAVDETVGARARSDLLEAKVEPLGERGAKTVSAAVRVAVEPGRAALDRLAGLREGAERAFVGGEPDDPLEPELASGAHREDNRWTAAGAEDHVIGLSGAVHEVPGVKISLLALDDQEALAGQDEEVLLCSLAVVQPHRLSRLEDVEVDAKLAEAPL